MTAATADPNGGGLTDEQAAVYDRQLRVWGVEAQKRMGASTFFVLGDLDGVAAEACKNIVLAGVGTLRIWDNGMDAHDANAPPGNFLATAGAAGKAAGRCVHRSIRPLSAPREIASVARRSLDLGIPSSSHLTRRPPSLSPSLPPWALPSLRPQHHRRARDARHAPGD